MHHPSWDDLDAFLETDDFAVTAQLHSETSGRVHQCTIVFDATYIDADIGDYRMNAPEPCFTCKETDVMHFKNMTTPSSKAATTASPTTHNRMEPAWPSCGWPRWCPHDWHPHPHPQPHRHRTSTQRH